MHSLRWRNTRHEKTVVGKEIESVVQLVHENVSHLAQGIVAFEDELLNEMSFLVAADHALVGRVGDV